MSNHREIAVPDFLPGRLTLAPGTVHDYDALSPLHYIALRPATWASICTVRYHDPHRTRSRPVAVGVLSYPMPSSAGREAFLVRTAFTRQQNLTFANQHIRTISRIIVHPQFRALGLSTLLVRCLCNICDTRYVEAFAAMGRIHPLFQRAGMIRIDPKDQSKPVYFIFDREDPVQQRGTDSQPQNRCAGSQSDDPSSMRIARHGLETRATGESVADPEPNVDRHGLETCATGESGANPEPNVDRHGLKTRATSSPPVTDDSTLRTLSARAGSP